MTVAACGSPSNSEDELSRDEIFDRIDQDDDGVVLRSDYQTAIALTDPAKVVASHPQGDITVEEVLASLADSPTS